MRLRKAADRTVSILGLGLFGVLTGFSLFLTSRFALSYEEIPRTTGDIFPLVLLICGCLTFVMYRISEWMLREEERQEQRVRILAGAVFCYALLLGVWWVGAARCGSGRGSGVHLYGCGAVSKRELRDAHHRFL